MLNLRRYQWWNKSIKPRFNRIVLSAFVFAIIPTSLAYSKLIQTNDISVEFPSEYVQELKNNAISYPIKTINIEDTIKRIKKKNIFFLSGVIGYSNSGRVSSFKSTDYVYTGASSFIDDGFFNNTKNWRIKFFTSGTFTPKKRVIVDICLVGGGGGGSGAREGVYEGSGGGGGWAGTMYNGTLSAGVGYSILIGGGGAGGGNSADGGNGGTTYFGSDGVPGGEGGRASGKRGGNGGSGGGGGIANGGSNGSNGGAQTYYTAGVGQGYTTKEFSESWVSTVYSAGGGGAGADGGAGGGNGAVGGVRYSSAGGTNTGGGGGGGTANGSADFRLGANGGSGILIIRNKR